MAAETATVLFTDLVGSTELLSRVGAERAEELRGEHFALLREVISRSGGREVKSLGDGLMVAFGGVTAALGCATAMQQGIEMRNRDATERLAIRVGVSHGEADVEGGDYFGLPVVEAARLCAKAEGGEILTTELVCAIAGSRGGFEFEAIGALKLKGLDQPVAARRVTWVPRSPADVICIPIPSRLAVASTSVFVGRAAERELLADALKTAAAGARALVLVAGEPGIGKTALASAFSCAAAEDGVVVLYGRSDEDLGIPYQPWGEALTHLVRHAPDDVLRAHVEERGGELARLVPDLAKRITVSSVSSNDAESERYRLFGAVVDLLGRVGWLAPVVLVLDDLHWADRASVQLLRHVVAADVPLRLLIIGTFRDSEIRNDDALAEALAALHRESGVERLRLRGLGDDELLALLEANAGHEMTDVVLRGALLRETDGNPFFVGEILRNLAETNAIYQDDAGRWVASPDLRVHGLPVSVREVIGRRVARLGAEAGRVLSMAAVIGRDFDVNLLGRVVDVDEDTLIDVLERAVSSAVVTEGDTAGAFRFAHALIEYTLYDDLSAVRRARAHRTVGLALEDICGGQPGDTVGQLAYHWAHATQPQDTTRVIEYTQLAGDRALAQLAPDEAVRWYRDALELLERSPQPDEHRRATLLTGLGDAQRQVGDPAHRRTLLDAAHLADDLGDTDTLVRAALANNRGFQSNAAGVVDEQRVAVLQAALNRLGNVITPERALLMATLCVEIMYRSPFAERLALAEEAVEIARQVGDPFTLAEVLTRPHNALDTPAGLAIRRQWTAEAATLVDEHNPVAHLIVHLYCAMSALEAADLPTIRRGIAVLQQEAARIGQPFYDWLAAFHHAWYSILNGDLGEAEQLTAEALRIGTESGEPDAIMIYGAQLLNIRYFQGRLSEMLPLVEQAIIEYPGLPGFRAAQCWATAETGDISRAIELLDRDLEDKFTVPEDSNWLITHVLWTQAAGRSGHSTAAAMLIERLAPWHGQFATTGANIFSAVAQALGLATHILARYDEADTWYAEALDIHQRLEAPVLIAQTQATWADLLVDRDRPGDRDQAHKLLDEALPIAVEHGYGFVERDAATVLARLN